MAGNDAYPFCLHFENMFSVFCVERVEVDVPPPSTGLGLLNFKWHYVSQAVSSQAMSSVSSHSS